MTPQEYLELKSISFRTITLANEVHTAQDVAIQCGCDVKTVIKSLVFWSDKGFALAAVSGDSRVSLAKLAKALGVTKVRLATAEETKLVTGYLIGTVSPFGLNDIDDIHFDKEFLVNKSELLFGSGRADTLIAIFSDEMIKSDTFQFADISEPN